MLGAKMLRVWFGAFSMPKRIHAFICVNRFGIFPTVSGWFRLTVYRVAVLVPLQLIPIRGKNRPLSHEIRLGLLRLDDVPA